MSEDQIISAVWLDPADNVISLLRAHKKGERPICEGAAAPALTADIPAGHKAALSEIAEGEMVIKYGLPIGRATAPVSPGDHVHLHNLRGEIG